MSLSNEVLNVSYSPISDIGAGIVFGLGYYLISHLYGDASTFEEFKKGLNHIKPQDLERATTIEQINNLIKMQEKEESLNPFEILRKINKQNIAPDISTYNILLNYCYQNGKYDFADKLEEEIFDFASPVHCNLMTYNIVLKGIGLKIQEVISPSKKGLLLEKMLKILNDLGKESSSIKPNEITLNSCLEIYIKSEEFEKAWDLFDSMSIKYNISPDNFSYSIIMKALRLNPSDEKLNKILKVIDIIKKKKELGESKSEYEEITFNCLIETCFKLRRIEKAEELFKLMKELKIPITKVCYSVMIKGYGQYYQKEKALDLFNLMKEQGVFPNEIVYGCVLNSCIRCHDLKNAKILIEEMKSHNFELNGHICSMMIKAYSQSGNFNSALELFYDSTHHNNIVIYNAIIHACVESGELKKMTEIYENLVKLIQTNPDSCPQPDLITLSTLIKGYSKSKNFEKVIEIYDYLEKQQKDGKVKLDEVLYNTILDACARNKQIRKGIEIIKRMKSQQINFSNVTYSIIIKLYSKQGDKKKIFEILKEMREMNIVPGLIVYTCLIQTCITKKDFYNAFSLFNELKNDNIAPDHVLYSSLINGCLSNKKIEASYTYILESFLNNVRMSDWIYNKFFQVLLSKRTYLKDSVKKEFCINIYTKLKERRFLLEKETIHEITDFLIRSKRGLLKYI